MRRLGPKSMSGAWLLGVHGALSNTERPPTSVTYVPPGTFEAKDARAPMPEWSKEMGVRHAV